MEICKNNGHFIFVGGFPHNKQAHMLCERTKQPAESSGFFFRDSQRRMYFVDFGFHVGIYRANLDGSDRITLHETDMEDPFGLTIGLYLSEKLRAYQFAQRPFLASRLKRSGLMESCPGPPGRSPLHCLGTPPSVVTYIHVPSPFCFFAMEPLL